MNLIKIYLLFLEGLGLFSFFSLFLMSLIIEDFFIFYVLEILIDIGFLFVFLIIWEIVFVILLKFKKLCLVLLFVYISI